MMSATAVFSRISIVTAALVLLLLLALHVLSPEFDPSWRVVSEYANGHYGWILSLMFVFWAISTWALAVALAPSLTTVVGKTGLCLLVASGVGDAMAAAFDINQPLHGLAGLLGVGCLPVAAMLISITVRRAQPTMRGRRLLLLTANSTWIAVIVLIASLALLFVTYTHAGGQVPADGRPLPVGTTLPHGAIALVGYANRLLVVMFCAWTVTAATLVRSSSLNVDQRLEAAVGN